MYSGKACRADKNQMNGVNEMDYLKATVFYHKELKNADGTPMRYRVNGRPKLWKTRPTDFKIPVKRGMYEHGYITHENIHLFTWGN
jgi:hypothetical protein